MANLKQFLRGKSMSSDRIYSKSKRNFGYAFSCFLRWISNPVSEDGPKHIFRLIYSVFGPEVHKIAEKARNNPVCKTMLANRVDLGQVLADMDRLSTLPEGSLGKMYHSFMSGDDILPSYIIGGMAYRDGHFDKLSDWDEDAKYLIERAGNTHDITHLISGYGTDLCGEAISISFSIGGCGLSKRKAKVLGVFVGCITWIFTRPTVGFRHWIRLNIDAALRGSIMAEKNSIIEIPFEEYLDSPLRKVREDLGIPVHKYPDYVNEEGFLVSADWMQSRIGKKMAQGFGSLETTKEGAFAIRKLVESGLPIRTVMSSNNENIRRAWNLADNGAEKHDILNALAI